MREYLQEKFKNKVHLEYTFSLRDPIPRGQSRCLPTMVPKADNMPKMQKGDREKYKGHTSDQGPPLVKFEN